VSRHGPRPLKRERQRSPQFELLVFTEGEVTEVNYLTHLHRQVRDAVTVSIDAFHGGPLQLVEHAIDSKDADTRGEQKGRGRARDGYWCVFDTDVHPNLDQAVQLAAAHDIGIGLSNPCLELWFMLHYADQTAYLTGQEAQSEWHRLCGARGKAVDAEVAAQLFERFAGAKVRATQLGAKHHLDGSPPGSNPSSSVWRLVDTILSHRPAF